MRQEIGTLGLIYANEITTTEATQANKELVESIKKTGRNWTPVIVVQMGSKKYKVLSGAEILEACKEARLAKVWTIIADDSEKTKKAVITENKVNKVIKVEKVTEESQENKKKPTKFEPNISYKSNNGLGTITVTDVSGLSIDVSDHYALFAKDEEKEVEEYLIKFSPSYGYFITHKKYGTIYATDKA